MKAVVAAFSQEKALVGAFSVITNLRMELFEALMWTLFMFTGQQSATLSPFLLFPVLVLMISGATVDSQTM